MNFNTLSSGERLAAWGAILGIVGGLLTAFFGGLGAGGLWVTLIISIAMLVVIFLPQWSPQTTLPGSKGTLMLIIGAIAAIGAVLALLGLLPWLGFIGELFIYILGLILGIVGGLMMGWGAWQVFQAEGGKFQLGSGTAGAGTRTTTTTTHTEPTAPPATGSGDMGERNYPDETRNP